MSFRFFSFPWTSASSYVMQTVTGPEKVPVNVISYEEPEGILKLAGAAGFINSVTVAVPSVVTLSNVRVASAVGETETPFPAGTTLFTVSASKVTDTEQSAMIGSVVNKSPDRVPEQVPPINAA